MNDSIMKAKAHFRLHMEEINSVEDMVAAWKDFMETSLHDKFSDTISHGDVEIAVIVSDDCIRICNIRHFTMCMNKYGCGNVYTLSIEEWKAFRDTFRETYPDEEYVDTVIRTLVQLMIENHFLYMV